MLYEFTGYIGQKGLHPLDQYQVGAACGCTSGNGDGAAFGEDLGISQGCATGHSWGYGIPENPWGPRVTTSIGAGVQYISVSCGPVRTGKTL